jgi:hypothetical protein
MHTKHCRRPTQTARNAPAGPLEGSEVLTRMGMVPDVAQRITHLAVAMAGMMVRGLAGAGGVWGAPEH